MVGKEDLAEDFDRIAEDKTGLKTQCQLRYCLTSSEYGPQT